MSSWEKVLNDKWKNLEFESVQSPCETKFNLMSKIEKNKHETIIKLIIK